MMSRPASSVSKGNTDVDRAARVMRVSRTAASLRASAKIRACYSVSKAISRPVRFGRPENSFDAPTMEVLLLLRLTLCGVVVVLAMTQPPPRTAGDLFS